MITSYVAGFYQVMKISLPVILNSLFYRLLYQKTNFKIQKRFCLQSRSIMADTQPNMNAPNGAQPPNTARIAVNPLINVQDRLFHTLFFRITLAYARGCPKPLRRIIEMMILVKVINH